MNKKVRLLFIIPSILLLIYIILNIVPIKMGISITNIKKSDNNKEVTIICQNTQVTGPTWAIIGNDKGLFEENKGEYIWTEGNIPENTLDSSLLNVANKYVFTGNFSGNKTVDGETLRVFKISDWKISKPINRDSLRMLFLINSNYLTIFDFKWASTNETKDIQ